MISESLPYVRYGQVAAVMSQHKPGQIVKIQPLLEDDEKLLPAMRWTVLYGIATRKHIKDYIETMYEQNRVAYFQAYKKSEFGIQSNNLTYFTTETQEMIVKTAGIFAWAEQEQDYRLFHSLIQKGFKYAWNHVKRHEKIELSGFVGELLKGGKTKPEEAYMLVVMGLYLCHHKGYDFLLDIEKSKRISDEMPTYLVATVFSFMEDIRQLFLWKPSEIPKKEQPFKIQHLEELWGVKKGIGKNLRQFILDIRQVETNALVDNLPFIYESNEALDIREKVQEEVGRKGQTRTFGALSQWLDFFGVAQDDLYEQFELTYPFFQMVFKDANDLRIDSQIHAEEENLFVSALLILSALADEYKKTKKKYLSLHVEEWEYEIQEKEKEWKQALNELDAKRKELESESNKELQQLKRQLDSLEKERDEWKKKSAQLEGELEKRLEPQKELDALKMFVLAQEQEESPLAHSFDEMVSWLQENNVVIIGGHPKWQTKLKELFPHFRFLDTEQINWDISFVNRADAVFVNTSFISHPFYWKVANSMNKNEVPLFFFDRSTNMERTVAVLFESLYTS